MNRATKKDKSGRYYLTGDGIYSDYGVPEKFYGDDVDNLGVIEDILGDDYSLDRLRELVEADNQGRIQVIPMRKGKECGACQHFQRIPGTRRGKCKVKPLVFSRYVSGGTPFEPSQSRKACMKFVPIKKEKSHE